MINLQAIPSIEQLLQIPKSGELISLFGRPRTVEALRITIEDVRANIKLRPDSTVPESKLILAEAEILLSGWTKTTLQTVINATGVILHTNLGRAPFSKATIAAMADVSKNYSNLEFNLETGKRGPRNTQIEVILRKLTGAEAALVVNNNASAVFLILRALASRKSVVIARSQLVEIGGGFRVPDIMKQSGRS